MRKLHACAMMLWQEASQGYAQSINFLMFLLKYQSPTAPAMVCETSSRFYSQCQKVYVLQVE